MHLFCCESNKFDRHVKDNDRGEMIPFNSVDACGLSLSADDCRLPEPSGIKMIAVGWWAAIFSNCNDNNGCGMSEDVLTVGIMTFGTSKGRIQATVTQLSWVSIIPTYSISWRSRTSPRSLHRDTNGSNNTHVPTTEV